MNKNVAIGSIALVFVAGGLYFLATNQSQSAEYDDYVAAKVLEIKEDQGITGTAVKAKPTQQNTQSPNWVLTVPINSLNSDIFITATVGATAWMDNARFDKELTEFEAKEKARLAQTQAKWETIIGSSDYSMQTIAEIQNNYIPQWQDRLQSLQTIQNAAAGVTTIFQSRWGAGKANVPVKYQDVYQWNFDMIAVLEDYIPLVETNITLKNETVANIQSKNIEAAVMSANDEDRITLVAGWFDERLNILLQSKGQMMEQLKQLIAEYPRN
jgi:hypothetical protein